MTSSDWTAWQGGECPVAGETRVQVRYRDGTESGISEASVWEWNWATETFVRNYEIVAYRIVSLAPPTAVQAAVEVEREACALIADIWAKTEPKSGNLVSYTATGMRDAGLAIASAIRARGNVEGK